MGKKERAKYEAHWAAISAPTQSVTVDVLVNRKRRNVTLKIAAHNSIYARIADAVGAVYGYDDDDCAMLDAALEIPTDSKAKIVSAIEAARSLLSDEDREMCNKWNPMFTQFGYAELVAGAAFDAQFGA